MNADSDMVELLRSLASALGAGGLDETDPAKLLARVEWGVDHIQQVEAARSAQVVEELSKQPRTTWGEVKKAIHARAALEAGCAGLVAENARLRSALERLDRNFDLLLAGKPVRDVAETKAETRTALRGDREQGEG